MHARKLEGLVRRCPHAFFPLLCGVAMLCGARTPAWAESVLLVTSQGDRTVKVYDGSTGAFVRSIGTSLGDPLDAIIGPDGNLLVTDGQQNAIRRFDWATGAPLDSFANPVTPEGMTIFEGKLYTCQANPPQIIRSFDATTGADTGSFTPTVGDGNPSPRDVKIAYGRLYVAYWNLGTVETFDLASRVSLGLLFPPGTGGLSTPSSLAFGPDGNLYVSYNTFVNRYHPTTGTFLGRFVDTGDRTGRRYAIGIAWGPDGNLYVATQNTPGVQRYDGITGAFTDDFVPEGLGGLSAPFHINFASVSTPTSTTTTLDVLTTSTTSTSLPPRCGDGRVTDGEQCDPGVDDPSDCCSATCRLLTSGVCRAAPDDVSPNERNCYLPAFCNGVDPFCPQNELNDGEVCADSDTCTPIDVCSGGRCLPGPAICDVAVPSELVVGDDETIPVTCSVTGGGRCRARAFVSAESMLRIEWARGAAKTGSCRKPVDGLCPITKAVGKHVPQGSTKVLSLRLNSLGKRLLARADAQASDVAATVQARVSGKTDVASPIRKELIVRLRR